jgi:hypothetical protein
MTAAFFSARFYRGAAIGSLLSSVTTLGLILLKQRTAP